MNVLASAKINASVSLDESEQFEIVEGSGSRRRVLVTAVGYHAAGSYERISGSGLVVKKDGTVGKAVASHVYLRFEEVPTAIVEAIRKATIEAAAAQVEELRKHVDPRLARYVGTSR